MDFEMLNAEIEGFKDKFLLIQNEIAKGIIGQEDIVVNVIAAIIAGGNVLIEGLPGLGKTRLVKTIGNVMDLKFSRIQFTPDLMPADVTGTDIIGDNGSFEFQEGPVFSNIVLADEINRATPKTQSSLLEAMQEKTVTVGRKTYKLPEPFFVLATQNPIEMEGTYPLPEAQLDRFLIKLNVGFPGKDDLKSIVELTAGNITGEDCIRTVTNPENIAKMGAAVKLVPIAQPVMDYAMDMVINTHPDSDTAPGTVKKYVRYGSSPRGAQALIIMSRIYALLDGRYNVSYGDINRACYTALGHRLYLNFEAMTDNVAVNDVLGALIDKN